MTDADLIEAVRREANSRGTREERASRTAELIRTRTGRRWVGIYRLAGGAIHGQSVDEHDDRVLGDEWQHQPWRLPAGVQRDELGIDPRGAPT
jgi:hypothetical protein